MQAGGRAARFLMALALLLLLTSSGSAAADEGASFIFHLVPTSDWPPDPSKVTALPGGRVFLFREGAHSPELVLEANRPSRVPPGSWVWTAEAPGYVSVVAGILEIPEEPEQEKPKGIYWPVVPACRIVLAKEARWAGVERLDVVSVPQDAVYPVVPAERRELWAPAGRLLAYGVGGRGLRGIDDLGACAQDEVVEVWPPSPPDGGHQELIVTAHLPEGLPEEDGSEVAVRVGGPGRRPLSPTAEIRVKDRLSSFFLDAPAADGLTVVFRHPGLRSRSVPIDPLGGSARELQEQTLEERLDLDLDIDYRPLAPHDRAEIWVYHCGDRRRLDPRSFGECRLLDQRPKLRPGLQRYTVEAVDDGLLHLEGRIDGFIVPGLGTSIQPYIDPMKDHPPQTETGLLIEQEIYGSILLDGDPVPGVVRLLGVFDSNRRLPDHAFPTGDDGTYRLRYFGRVPEPFLRPPGFEGSSDPTDLLGLYGDYQLAACTDTGFCRPYSLHSVLQGEGRLDLELGDRTPVEVAVADAESGEPVEDAVVSFERPAKALYFHHGEVDWFEPRGSEASYVWSDDGGTARIFAQAQGGTVFLLIHHPDYELLRQEVEVDPRRRNRVDVQLEPKEEHQGDLQLVFPDGAPVPSGSLLVLDPVTGLDGRCSTETSSRGFADVSPRCLYGRTVVVFAPGARISTLEGTSLASFDRVEIPRAPSRPLTLRVVDEEGNPVEGVPIRLRYPDVTLGPNHFLIAATLTGHQIPFATNARGELVLDGVDPEAVTVPDVGTALEEGEGWEPLASYHPGDVVVLTVRSP